MDYYVASALEIYRKHLMTGKQLRQNSFLHTRTIMSAV